ncbi:MAG: hypothetical protein H7289_05040 [Mucilaginibacter sp.]|nr:hypothetical protein [Mucilaginibacter sp.]
MIKRLTTLFLTKVYIITVLGFALNLHYCGDVLASVKVNAPAKNCTPVAVKKMKCCNDKHVEVKIKDAHQGESQSILSKIFAFELPEISFGDYFLSAQKELLQKLSGSDPPAPPPPYSGKAAQYIKNCALLI